MRKQITIITLGIIMIAGAMAMYGGDSMKFEVDLTNPVYTVIGNESSLEGLDVTFENGKITISPALNYEPDNFTLIFFDNLTREIVKTIHTRGRSSSTIRYVDNNVTVYVPEYINTTIEVEKVVEVEKIVKIPETIVVEKGYELWHVLLGLATGLIFSWFIFKKEKEVQIETETAEDIVEELDEY